MDQKNIAVTFCAGVGSVTGANFLLEIAGKKILIDCGLEQGSEESNLRNREDFLYDPSTIDFLLITHAHTDHIGRIPKLIKDGFNGVIYSTPATFDLSNVMLPDTLHLIQEDARKKGVLPMFEPEHVEKALSLWKTINYYQDFVISDGVHVYLLDSGHILGSCMYKISREGSDKSIIFTGDLGNSPALFLRDTDAITGATYVVMESVYGDRNHEPHDERKQKLTEIIKKCIQAKKTLLIPVFSLERTEDILFELNDLVEHKLIPEVKVYVDSPLASKVTEVYKAYSKDFNAHAKELLQHDKDVFSFRSLQNTVEHKDSDHIDHTVGPKIILAGSGMSSGGRILQHEMQYLPDPQATILFVGYQAAGTLGRQILDGAKSVKIQGQDISVRAEVESIMGYSSHKDSDHLVEFVSGAHDTLKKAFVVMGEPQSALFLVQKIRDNTGIDAMFPKQGERVELSL